MPSITLPISSVTIHYSDFTVVESETLTPSWTSSASAQRTLVFIHGLGSSQNFYLPFVSLLPVGTRCILLDTPGAARSPLPDNAAPPSISSLATIVWEFLDALSVLDVTAVVGHSMGCLVALHMAQLRAQDVGSLVLFGPIYPNPKLAELFADRIDIVRKGGMEAMANTIPSTATGSRTTPLQKAFIRELLLGQSVEGYTALCNAIATATVGELGKVKARVLVVAGSKDKSAPVESCKYITKELGDAEMKIVDGCGHWHVIEMAEEMARLMGAFLEQ